MSLPLPPIHKSLALPGRFLAWWLGELAGLVDVLTGGRLTRHRVVLIATAKNSQMTFRLRANGSERILGHCAEQAAALAPDLAANIAKASDKPLSVTLECSADRALIRDIGLPAAAENTLDDVLAFEISRQTPFRVDQVFWGHGGVTRDATSKRLSVRLAVIPKAALEADIDRLTRWGLAPQSIILAGSAGKVGDADLRIAIIGSTTGGDRRPGPLARPRLAVLVAAIVIAGAVLPVYLKSRAKADLERRIEAVREDAAAAAELRRKLARAMGHSARLQNQKHSRPVITAVVNEVARILPDDSWLDRLEIRDFDLQIHGTSPQATRLIGLFESSPYFSDVRFRAPVTRDERAGAERFAISATLAAGLHRP